MFAVGFPFLPLLKQHREMSASLRRAFSTVSRNKLRVGLIPADGIGREVIPAAQDAILALGSAIPKPEFVNLDAGFEYFKKHGTALPEASVQ